MHAIRQLCAIQKASSQPGIVRICLRLVDASSCSVFVFRCSYIVSRIKFTQFRINYEHAKFCVCNIMERENVVLFSFDTSISSTIVSKSHLSHSANNRGIIEIETASNSGHETGRPLIRLRSAAVCVDDFINSIVPFALIAFVVSETRVCLAARRTQPEGQCWPCRVDDVITSTF